VHTLPQQADRLVFAIGESAQKGCGCALVHRVHGGHDIAEDASLAGSTAIFTFSLSLSRHLTHGVDVGASASLSQQRFSGGIAHCTLSSTRAGTEHCRAAAADVAAGAVDAAA